MRTLLRLAAAAACALAAAAPAAAGDRDDALAVIDQALQAHGGADAMAKAQSVTRTGAGTLFPGGKETPFTDEVSLNLPDQMRFALDVDKRVKILVVVNGDKGWQSAGGPVSEMGADRLKELHEEMYLLWLTTLAPLKTDDFDLAPVKEEAKVNGQPAVGVRVGRKGHGDVTLWFDKSSHLLVKAARRGEEGGLPVAKEYVYGDHKDFDGAKLPTHIVDSVDGKKFNEITSASYKLVRKFDDGTFAKP
jgi:hypothetical protein